MPAPAQRSIIWPPRHRLTFRFTSLRTADEALGGVGGRERAAQPRRELERGHRERFVQAFTDALGRAGVRSSQPPGEIEQEPLRSL